MPDNLISIGKITRAVGLKGRFKIRIFTKGSLTLNSVSKIFIEESPGSFKPLEIKELALRHDSASVIVEGVFTLEDVEALKNCEVFVDKSELPAKEADEYYHHELVGSDVYSTEGEYIGKLTNIIDTKANDVFCITKDGKEILIPAVENVVKFIDVENKIIKIDPYEEMLDD